MENHECLVLWQALIARDLADTDPPFDVLPTGAMVAHHRARTAASAEDTCQTPEALSDRAPQPPEAPLALLITLEALATPVLGHALLLAPLRSEFLDLSALALVARCTVT